MNIPDYQQLNEFNRVLLTLQQLAGVDSDYDIKAVIGLCSSLVFGGQSSNHFSTLNLCNYAGLVSIKSERVKLTPLGEKFLTHNANHQYEITGNQKDFVARELLLTGPWRRQTRGLLVCFEPNYDQLTYELSLTETPLPSKFNPAIFSLVSLGVLTKSSNKLVVDPKYVYLVKQIRSNHLGMSEKELEQALSDNMRLADQAELAAVEYEKARLTALGRTLEASMIRRISQLDVQAGYDIQSFNGTQTMFEYDRFIEVKSSSGTDINFFWSENERKIAKQKNNNYWIYFFGGLPKKVTEKVTPIMIQNPFERLESMASFSIRVASYHIIQIDVVQLNKTTFGGLECTLLADS